jgi:hypothetical protein
MNHQRVVCLVVLNRVRQQITTIIDTTLYIHYTDRLAAGAGEEPFVMVRWYPRQPRKTPFLGLQNDSEFGIF